MNSIAICIAAGALSACAATPDPKPEIESARALVEQAEQAGAAEFAGRDFETARDRLRLAEDADEAHHDDAQRFADQAAVNAQLAMANTAAAKAERAAAESQQSIDALRQETKRPSTTTTTTTTTVRPERRLTMRIRHLWRTSPSSLGVLAILAGCASTPENTVELERARDAVAKVAGTSDSSIVASAELKEAQETLRREENRRVEVVLSDSRGEFRESARRTASINY